MTPDISIIIVSWNARKFLQECLQSLEEDVSKNGYEVIVVDNDSADGSPQMVAQDFPHIRLIETGNNLGFAGGNNVGVRASNGRYLCFINSDVHVLPSCLGKLLSFMESNQDAGMVGPRILNRDMSVQASCRTFPTLLGSLCQALGLDSIFRGVRAGGFFLCKSEVTSQEVDVLSGCFWMVRSEALEKVGLLDETFFMYSEDIDWCKRFWKNDWKVIHLPSAQAVHYGGASSSSAPIRFFLEMQKARLQYWRKHHGRIGSTLGRAIMFFHQAIRLAPRSLMFCIFPANRAMNSFKIRRSAACLKWLLHI